MLVIALFIVSTLGVTCGEAGCRNQVTNTFCANAARWRPKNPYPETQNAGACDEREGRNRCCEKYITCSTWNCGGDFVDKAGKNGLEWRGNLPYHSPEMMNQKCCDEKPLCSTICPAGDRIAKMKFDGITEKRCTTLPCQNTPEAIDECCQPFCCGISAATNQCCGGQTWDEAKTATTGKDGGVAACCHQTGNGDSRPHITKSKAGAKKHYTCKTGDLMAHGNAAAGCNGSAAGWAALLTATEVRASAPEESSLVAQDVLIIAATGFVVGGLYLSVRKCLQGTPKQYQVLLDGEEEA